MIHEFSEYDVESSYTVFTARTILCLVHPPSGQSCDASLLRCSLWQSFDAVLYVVLCAVHGAVCNIFTPFAHLGHCINLLCKPGMYIDSVDFVALVVACV